MKRQSTYKLAPRAKTFLEVHLWHTLGPFILLCGHEHHLLIPGLDPKNKTQKG